MAIYYVKVREVLFHVYVVEAESEEEAQENFEMEEDLESINTECLEYAVESVEQVPEKDEQYARRYLEPKAETA